MNLIYQNLNIEEFQKLRNTETWSSLILWLIQRTDVIGGADSDRTLTCSLLELGQDDWTAVAGLLPQILHIRQDIRSASIILKLTTEPPPTQNASHIDRIVQVIELKSDVWVETAKIFTPKQDLELDQVLKHVLGLAGQ